MKWLPWTRKSAQPAEDPTIVALSARADQILEELDVVVKQMSTMLREKGAADHE
jgi:hypothetical protein